MYIYIYIYTYIYMHIHTSHTPASKIQATTNNALYTAKTPLSQG